MHKGEKMSAAEVIMTQLHAGENLTMILQSFWRITWSGVSVVNALSEKLELNIYRDGNDMRLGLRMETRFDH